MEIKTKYGEAPEYDPNDLLEVKNDYLEGGKYKISTFKWGINNKIEIESEKTCDTFNGFCEIIWDSFADFFEKNAINFISPFGLKNENPYRSRQIFYDGYSLVMNRKLFMECINNKTVDRFYSFVKKCTNIQIDKL